MERRNRLAALQREQFRRQLQRQFADMAAASDPSDPVAQQEAQERLQRHDAVAAEELVGEFQENGYL